MTDQPDDELGQLPSEVYATQAFIARLPSQRVIDLLKRLESDLDFGELMEQQPPRMIAFRALLRDYPRRDPTSLWMHAYDVEVAIVDVDPYERQVADALAAFCAYYRMSPTEVDDLPDVTWDAMVRRMQAEAAAIRQTAATTKLPTR